MYLMHYGVKRRSGRYEWGSGENPYQHEPWFHNMVKKLKASGMSEKEIANSFKVPMTVKELRAHVSISRNEKRASDIAQAVRLKEKGYSLMAIAERLNLSGESQVRSLLKAYDNRSENIFEATTTVLKDAIDKQHYIDVGSGVELYLGVSRTHLDAALIDLKDGDGYHLYKFKQEQLGTGKETERKVLAAPDVTLSEVLKNKEKIGVVGVFSEDGGETYTPIVKPRNVDSKRIQVRYAEEGGKEKDGVIELRRGVDDISLGNAKYAQVRIAVDGTHYLKGMAMYSDDMPDGVDIIFNTNKKLGTPTMLDDPKAKQVFKPMQQGDEENPFGATIKGEKDLIRAQRYYTDKDGNRQLSALNVVNEEGDWGNWSKNIASQMLSKQSPTLAKKQLDLAYKSKADEFEEIMSLTQPVVRQKLLAAFADECDSAAVDLKAAPFQRQGTFAILPIPSMKSTEIYAPKYEDGEEVVLIRYPHAGIFEIPRLTVNNKNRDAKSVMGNAEDAVGINAKVAEQLSGADFDGDTVLVIPTKTAKIKTAPAQKDLIDFDPKASYPAYEGMHRMTKSEKGIEMGKISNLITDMTVGGAPLEDIVKAVKHSMVVIDAEKHNLNYKQSEIDHDIAALKTEWQGGANRGASTLISKASSTEYVNTRRVKIDLNTGKKVYEYTNYTNKIGEYFVDPRTNKRVYTGKMSEAERDALLEQVRSETGKKVKLVPAHEKLKTTKSTKMYEHEDAFELSSGTAIEAVYAQHANRLKDLANQARKESVNTHYTYSPSANKTYAKEVESLDAKLNMALMNAPLERKAQAIADAKVKLKRDANPEMDADHVKKEKAIALTKARNQVGAHKSLVNITDKEWEAIQAGAVTKTTLSKIMANSDLDRIKELATPRPVVTLPANTIARARQMLKAGHTQAEVANALGISTSTLSKVLNP